MPQTGLMLILCFLAGSLGQVRLRRPHENAWRKPWDRAGDTAGQAEGFMFSFSGSCDEGVRGNIGAAVRSDVPFRKHYLPHPFFAFNSRSKHRDDSAALGMHAATCNSCNML